MRAISPARPGAAPAPCFRLARYCLLSLGFLLAACGAPRVPPPVVQAETSPPVEAGEGLDLSLAPPPQTPGEPARRPLPRDVLNKSSAEVRALFGEPGLVRRELPAEVWQYQADQPACVLIFVLYPAENAAAQLRVRHAQSVPRRRGASIDESDCLAAMLKPAPGSPRPVS